MILNKLLEQNILQFSPSHYENAYVDRYVVQNAAAKEGIIVSNDHFRDLKGEHEAFKEATKLAKEELSTKLNDKANSGRCASKAVTNNNNRITRALPESQ